MFECIERLRSIGGVGPITALTWALEVGDPQRFSSNRVAMSYCGLTPALRSSAGKEQRGPISKQRNAWLQTALLEAAKLAPRWNPQLAVLHARELQRGHANRATLQVARKLVAYLLAVDKSYQKFSVRAASGPPAGPRVVRDCANKPRLRMRLTVCFEAGRFVVPFRGHDWMVDDYSSSVESGINTAIVELS